MDERLNRRDVTPHASLVAVPLDTELVGSRIIAFEEVASTNDLALRTGGDGAVFVTDSQVAGRGRQGRSWHSPPGLGLWFSVALEGRQEGLGFAASLAVRDALRGYCPVEVKWPNDLLSGGKKICGILVEHRRDRTALGIGINVLHQPEDFPEAIRGRATSVAMVADRPVDRGELLREVLTRLDKRVMLLRRGGAESIRREWIAACKLLGRRIRCDDVTGTVVDIDASGALVLDTPQGRQRFGSGEINLVEGV